MMNYYIRGTKRQHQITKKELKEIEKRQLLAIRMNNIAEIEDAKIKVLTIIDKVGLESSDDKIKLETALKILPFIIPQKRQTEITHIQKRIEDIIKEHIEDAQIIEETNKGETHVQERISESNP